MTRLKWKNVGDKMYESGEWLIENQKTWLNPHQGWAIYRGRIFIERVRTLGAAKIRVQMELDKKVPAKPTISFIALQEPDVRREEVEALWEDIRQ